MEPPEKSSKTVADSPSPSKRTAQYAKTTRKEGSKASPAKSRRQNGDGVSSNGKKESYGDVLSFGDLRLDSLDDSEMNGVSSLLKMQESQGLKGLGSVLDFIDRDENRGIVAGDGGDVPAGGGAKETSGFGARGNEGNPVGNTRELNENDRVEGWEDVGDEGHGFRVGDFVWGKIRSHPWWPGRIYDPLDASDYAKKVKQTDKILVAYFGDGTFAWCSPSQLIPFEHNFLDMSMQSSSKSFVNAVEEAVNEVGRLVDLKMTCSCVPKDDLIGFGRTLVVNAGIKEGLLVPEAGIHKFPAALFEPTEFLPALRHSAQVAIAPNVLELSIIKYWLSAFYRAKGGYQLPKYHEPQPIPGLEDDTKNWSAERNTHSSGVEVAAQGPVDDWLSLPLSPKFGQNTESLIKKCQGISDDRHYHRRKQKSIAQILAGQTDAEAESKKDDVTSDETATSTQKKKRRGINKLVGTNVNAQGKVELGDATKDWSNSGMPASLPGMKKRKESDDADGGGQTKVQDVAEAGTLLGKPASFTGRKKSKIGDETVGEPKNAARDVAEPRTDSKSAASSSEGEKRGVSGEANIYGGSASISEPKTMKQTQFFYSIVASDNRVASLEIDDGGKKASTVNPMLKDRKKRESASDEYDIGAKNESEYNMAAAEKSRDGGLSSPTSYSEGSMSRERKKSKYLCPPFTNVERGHRKKEVEEESQRVWKQTSDNLDPQTPKQDPSSVIGPAQLNLSVNEILSQIRSAALDPTYLGEDDSLNMAEGFLSAFRSSIYSSGSDDLVSYKKPQPGKKRKSQESESGSSMKEQNQADLISDDQKSGTTGNQKNEAGKSDKPNENQTASAPYAEEKEQEYDGIAPAAALILTFGPGASIPSKDDAIKMYGKFGALDEEETEILYNHRSASIVFLRSQEAEEAFNVSQLASPFGAANVTFQLRYLSADTKTRKLKEISSSQDSPAKEGGGMTTNNTLSSHVSSSNVSQLNHIKQKLELMTSMLSDGKMSPLTKSKLQTEMKSLLEEVSTMAAASSSQKVNLS